MQAYQQYHPSQSNITKAEKLTLRTLKKRDVIIKLGEKVYKQKKGIAMGNHLAPP